MSDIYVDVLIIGAGPAGATAASLIKQAGFDALVIEKQMFPRFVIGESLLPHAMDLLEEAELLDIVTAQNFIKKDGAVFKRGDETCTFKFSQQFTKGWSYTHQVPRADFDLALAQGIEAKGIPIYWKYGVEGVEFMPDGTSKTKIVSDEGDVKTVHAKFILDGSGYGRVLPRLLDLEQESTLPLRKAYFTHVTGDIRPEGAAEGRIWVCMLDDPDNAWMWVIPFSNGKTSIGVVAKPGFLDKFPEDPDEKLRAIIESNQVVNERLKDSKFTFPVKKIEGYSISVKSLYGNGFALMGNSTEFLDPVFSSGVTLALESANRAAKTAIRELQGKNPDWKVEYADHLMLGVNTFRTFVEAWYDGRLATIFFEPNKTESFHNQICSILAGYVWDTTNPCVRDHSRAIDAIAIACKKLN